MDPFLLSDLAVRARHLVPVLLEVLGLQLDQGNLGNQAFLCLLADLECLILEVRGHPSHHWTLGILVVPLGQVGQVDLVAPVSQ